MSSPILGNSFIGIAIPEHISRLITGLYNNELKNIKYVKPSNLHITLSFLGIINAAEIDLIKKSLNNLQFKDFYITFDKAVFWNPNVVVIETETDFFLNEIKREIDRLIFQYAFTPPNEKPFRPHITIARVKAKSDRAELHAYLDKYNTLHQKRFKIEQIHLYQSVRFEGKQGDYIKLFTKESE